MAVEPDGKDKAAALENDINDPKTQKTDRLPSGTDTETGQMSVDTSALGGGALAADALDRDNSDGSGPDIDGGSR